MKKNYHGAWPSMIGNCAYGAWPSIITRRRVGIPKNAVRPMLVVARSQFRHSAGVKCLLRAIGLREIVGHLPRKINHNKYGIIGKRRNLR